MVLIKAKWTGWDYWHDQSYLIIQNVFLFLFVRFLFFPKWKGFCLKKNNFLKMFNRFKSIHHCQTLWSSYRKLAWVGYELTTTEFRSDALTNWAIRPWAQLALRANFVYIYIYIYIYICIYIKFLNYCKRIIFKCFRIHYFFETLIFLNRQFCVCVGGNA